MKLHLMMSRRSKSCHILSSKGTVSSSSSAVDVIWAAIPVGIGATSSRARGLIGSTLLLGSHLHQLLLGNKGTISSSTSWHWGNIQQGKRSHWVHTASWQPSSPASAWQQRDSQQQWQHSRCCQGSSTSWHWGNIQQGRQSHWVHTASWQPSS